MARINERNDWFEIWVQDKECILNVMIKNMVSDLDCGYDYYGNCIKNQRADIDNYKRQFENELDSFKFMDDRQVNRWCFYDLKKRGAIA